MNINRLLSLTLVLAAVLSCEKDANHYGDSAPQNPASKVVNTPEESDPASVMIYVNHAPSDATVSEWIAEGITCVERVFPSVPGNEADEARFNLDKWYIVKLGEGISTSKAAELLSSASCVKKIQFNKEFRQEPSSQLYVASSDQIKPFSVAEQETGFNDPRLYEQWHYINNGDKNICSTVCEGADINVKDAWRLIQGDPELVVAVVDAGVMYTHPDLAPNMWVNPNEKEDGTDTDGNGYVDDIHGANFVTDGAITWTGDKDSGHGTHVAGTIAAVNNNGIGVCGIAGGSGNNDGVKIMSCQIFNNGMSNEFAVAKAFKYAADNGACILQCSFGLDGGQFTSDNQYIGYSEHNLAVVDALNYFRSKNNFPALKGGMAIFASGNEGQSYAAYPGALKENICVTAIGPDYLPASYTNFGPGCNIAAPGGDADLGSGRAGILSTFPDGENKNTPGYTWMQGTSMACPHVSGVVALGLAYAHKLGKVFTYQEMTDMVLTSVNDLDGRMIGNKLGTNLEKYRKKMGTGTIDAWKLLMQIEGTPSAIVTINERQPISLAPFFGGSYVNLTYLGVDIDHATKTALGITDNPEVKNGMLYITPTKSGSGKVTIRAIAGGENLGGGDTMGGMEISKEVSIIARSFNSSNGGWL